MRRRWGTVPVLYPCATAIGESTRTSAAAEMEEHTAEPPRHQPDLPPPRLLTHGLELSLLPICTLAFLLELLRASASTSVSPTSPCPRGATPRAPAALPRRPATGKSEQLSPPYKGSDLGLHIGSLHQENHPIHCAIFPMADLIHPNRVVNLDKRPPNLAFFS